MDLVLDWSSVFVFLVACSQLFKMDRSLILYLFMIMLISLVLLSSTRNKIHVNCKRNCLWMIYLVKILTECVGIKLLFAKLLWVEWDVH